MKFYLIQLNKIKNWYFFSKSWVQTLHNSVFSLFYLAKVKKCAILELAIF